MNRKRKLSRALIPGLIFCGLFFGVAAGAQEPSKTSSPQAVTVERLQAEPAAAATPPAQAASKIDTGDTAWMLISAALVLLMTPGLALFYGGMVRTKNVMGTLMHSFIIMALVTVQWVLWGYSLAFGPDVGGIIGGLSWIGLNGVGLAPHPDYAATVPHQAFMIYQGMFAIITPALISGAIAERIKFSAFVLFTLLWATLVYGPIAHWVWGVGGWIRQMGALDFAGGERWSISVRGFPPWRPLSCWEKGWGSEGSPWPPITFP